MNRPAIALLLALGVASCSQSCPVPPAPKAAPATPKPAQSVFPVLFPKNAEPAVKPPVATAPRASAPPKAAKPAKAPAPKVKPKKPAAMPAWCARVPSWVSLERVKSEAAAELKRPLTKREIRQAEACIASKR